MWRLISPVNFARPPAVVRLCLDAAAVIGARIAAADKEIVTTCGASQVIKHIIVHQRRPHIHANSPHIDDATWLIRRKPDHTSSCCGLLTPTVRISAGRRALAGSVRPLCCPRLRAAAWRRACSRPPRCTAAPRPCAAAVAALRAPPSRWRQWRRRQRVRSMPSAAAAAVAWIA